MFPSFRQNQGPAQAVRRFGLPVFVRWRAGDAPTSFLLAVGLQSNMSVVTAILDIATLLLWSSVINNLA